MAVRVLRSLAPSLPSGTPPSIMAKHRIRMLGANARHLGREITFKQFKKALLSYGEPRELADISITLQGSAYHGSLIWYLKSFPKPESGYDLGGVSVEFKFTRSAVLLLRIKSFLQKMSSNDSPILFTTDMRSIESMANNWSKVPSRPKSQRDDQKEWDLFRANIRNVLEPKKKSSAATSALITDNDQYLSAEIWRKGSGRNFTGSFSFPRVRNYLTTLLDAYSKIEKKGQISVSNACLSRYSIKTVESHSKDNKPIIHLLYGHYKSKSPISFKAFSDIIESQDHVNATPVVSLRAFKNSVRVTLSGFNGVDATLDKFLIPRSKNILQKVFRLLKKNIDPDSFIIDLSCLSKFSLRMPRKHDLTDDEIPF
jgi:hypothetical protein